MQAVAKLAPDCGVITAACAALDLSRASFHRHQAAATRPPIPVRPRPKPARALAANERQTVISLLRAEPYVDLAPAEVYASLLDQGTYHCSIRTMYRILHEHDKINEHGKCCSVRATVSGRRRQARRLPRLIDPARRPWPVHESQGHSLSARRSRCDQVAQSPAYFKRQSILGEPLQNHEISAAVPKTMRLYPGCQEVLS